ncbi:histidine kinase [Actinomadura rupiterrae]|uniref:histidine kinase n=1 Tax=Actinomadura rupiterrae TaxID=559627 RepID=UPI0020A2A7C7|nr:histidine kinase [Actinomadura rupiterrae]MCP2339274.1 two-component system sensor histidine kinase DesK [Actinomadura rupiterrae]
MAQESADRLVRLTTAAVITWNVALAVKCLYPTVMSPVVPGRAAIAIAATALYLPLYIALVNGTIRGIGPRRSGWLLAGVAVVIMAAMPFAGANWPLAVTVLVGLALVVIPPPWSLGVVAALTAVAVLATVAWTRVPAGAARADFAVRGIAVFAALNTLWWGISLAVLVWLARILRQVQAARRELALRAAVAERSRIDAELTGTIGSALDRIVADSQAAARAAPDDPEAAAQALRAVTGRSRAALLQARRMLSGYRNVSLEAELQAAAALLSAGGIRAEVVLPDSGLPARMPQEVRASLRPVVARALADPALRECALTVQAGAEGGLAVRLIDRTARG